MVQYIHYGSKNFDPNRFEQITNIQSAINKPHGGLWASRVGAKRSWRYWCEKEDFGCLDTSFCFQISPTAKVCHLYTGKDLDLLPQRDDYHSGVEFLFFPDFEQMVKDGWDAIELHLSSTDENWDNDGLYWRLYGWDCDSILIMNKDIVLPSNPS